MALAIKQIESQLAKRKKQKSSFFKFPTLGTSNSSAAYVMDQNAIAILQQLQQQVHDLTRSNAALTAEAQLRRADEERRRADEERT